MMPRGLPDAYQGERLASGSFLICYHAGTNNHEVLPTIVSVVFKPRP